MLRSAIKERIFAIATLLLLPCACSIVGLGIGSLVDKARKDTYSGMPGWDITTLKEGSKMRIHLVDGDFVMGEFLTTGKMKWPEYKEKYENYKNAMIDELPLPNLEETVVAIDTAGKAWEIEFLGLDYNSVRFKDTSQPQPRNVDINMIDRIVTQSGDTLEVGSIEELAFKSPAPVMTTLILREIDIYGRPYYSRSAVSNTIEFPLDEIDQVQIKNKENGALTGFILGAIVDVVIVGILISGQDEPPPKTTPADTSVCGCPFIYSYNGANFVRDSEAFGGSIFRAAERTDLDRLDELKETNGFCAIRIVDELQETDYVDEVKLLAVDHNPEIEVIPSFSGQLFSLREKKAPTKACDFSGSDILNLIDRKDDQFWTSNLFRRTGFSDNIRDGIEVEFDRPQDSDQLKLVFNIKNTLWAARIQSAYLQMHGNKIESWYELMNSSEEARDEVIEAFVREGMLSVYIWNESEWTPAGFVWEIGTTVFRDQVLPIEIGNVQGNTIRLRIESTAGFWIINSVLADFSENEELSSVEIAPFSARDFSGADQIEAIGKIDGKYCRMLTGDRIELKFKPPAPADGLKRTFILMTSGYYRVNIENDDNPQTELLDRFLKEPGEFGRYTIDLFDRYYSNYINYIKEGDNSEKGDKSF